ncbi:GH36-type glycosyl hydrolase domain-containing protein [Roseateles sp.]|uniref:GH36-type glycosyl hydrolase domain-containing protein n=1 Tax=Roseateles sp. TaxID=1971397 RepID=UPI00395A43AE
MSAPPFTLLRNAAGLQFELLSHGSPRRILADGLMLNLFPGTELEGGLTNLWLYANGRTTALLGPGSPLSFQTEPHGLLGLGHWGRLQLRLSLTLHPESLAWAWRLEQRNLGTEPIETTLVMTQDVGLADYGAIRLNEFYVSQYLDHQPLTDPKHGTVLAVRQNQPQGSRHPQLLASSLRRTVAYATDALQVFGRRARETQHLPAPQLPLPSRRLQHEHAMVALQDEALSLAPGGGGHTGFVFELCLHHPAPSSAADLHRLDAPRRQLPTLAVPSSGAGRAVVASLFHNAPQWPVRDLSLDELTEHFPGERRHEEWQGTQLLSFFQTDAAGQPRHVALRTKELAVDRPHGHLLRSGRHLTPDETALTSTCWMGGVFHSMLTQGHVSFNRVLSTQRSYLGLIRSNGLRVFVDGPEGWQLLGLPSAFEMGPQHCRWIYACGTGREGRVIEVCSRANATPDRMQLQLRTLAGAPARVRLSLQLALTGDDGATPATSSLLAQLTRHGQALRVGLPPGSALAERFPRGAFWLSVGESSEIQRLGDDALLYPDATSRHQPQLCLDLAAASVHDIELHVALTPETPDAPRQPGQALPLPRFSGPAAPQMAVVADMLPWFQHNALVHFLSPRGLEQYSGGGWGTRDVCQGPVEMLLALGETAPVRDLLLRTFSAQNADGDWPQWFMFFERDAAVRAGDSHGDIVFWPVFALAHYLIASGDASVLDELLPFHDDAPALLREHLARALALIQRRLVPGTRLTAYWHGDWNDSLQPADPLLRERLASSWTVTLQVQTLALIARALHLVGDAALAERCAREAEAVQAEFQHLLVQDGVVAGCGYFPADGARELWIHPADTRTGLRYSLLPMMHAVLADMLSPAQAEQQVALIQQLLQGPDGARLFDAPIPYAGGVSTRFQRAETASFFGREIGIMYMHAHLRWCQTLAHLGRAQDFWDALQQAIPIGLPERVPASSRRQSNCYYSSSDAAFPDRYAASLGYAAALAGEVPLDGGWRVYSSGPGIALGLVLRHLLGVQLEHDAVLLDPVLPASLDGLEVSVRLGGIDFELRYRVGALGHGVRQVLADDGLPVPATRRAHAYRTGALAVARPEVGSVVRWTVEVG